MSKRINVNMFPFSACDCFCDQDCFINAKFDMYNTMIISDTHGGVTWIYFTKMQVDIVITKSRTNIVV